MLWLWSVVMLAFHCYHRSSINVWTEGEVGRMELCLWWQGLTENESESESDPGS